MEVVVAVWQLIVAANMTAERDILTTATKDNMVMVAGEITTQTTKAYCDKEHAEWCEDRARELNQEIKTGSSEKDTLEATTAEKEAQEKSLNAKIDELAASIATDEADLKAATEIRGTEEADFKAEEGELMQTISMLERAIAILEHEMAKGGASMLQMQNVKGLAQAFTAKVQASMMSSADVTRLTALVQQSTSGQEADDDEASGAPAAAVYENQGGDIVDVLKGLLEKAEAQLDSARRKETLNEHSGADPFAKIKGLIEDKIEKLITKIDQMTARSMTLKEEVAVLQKALVKLAAAQAEMDKLREQEHEAYLSNKADMEKGLEGVKIALKVLREYYAKDVAHEAAKGAGANIIGLLEVVESDFPKDLVDIESVEEAAAAAAYDEDSKESAVEKASKEKDVEHKIKCDEPLSQEECENEFMVLGRARERPTCGSMATEEEELVKLGMACDAMVGARAR